MKFLSRKGSDNPSDVEAILNSLRDRNAARLTKTSNSQAEAVQPQDDDGDVTVLASPSSSIKDAIKAQEIDEDATLMAPPPSSKVKTTKTQEIDEDATLMAPPRSKAKTILLPEDDDEDATLMAPPPSSEAKTILSPEDDEDATIVATPTSREDLTVVDTASKSAANTLLNAKPGVVNWKDKRQKERMWIDTAMDVDSDEQTLVLDSNGLPAQLIQAGLLRKRTVALLLDESQRSGISLFKALVGGRSSKKVAQIFDWLDNQIEWNVINDEETLDGRIISTDWLSYEKALELGVVALRTEDQEQFSYGALDPFDVVVRDWIERCSGRRADVVWVNTEVCGQELNRRKEQPDSDAESVGLTIDFSQDEDSSIRENINEIDVPMMVNYFLYRAHLQGASDIHIEATDKLMMVRNRVHGILHTEITLPMDFHAETVSRLKILSTMDVAEKRRPQDGRMSLIIRNHPIDIRVSSYPTVFGEKFVLRILDRSALMPSVEKLGLLENDLRLLKEKLAAPFGLILISGPTGSGKTTTLYSCLGGMDKIRKNILTVEDPVEYRLPGVHQMQVNHKIGVTFASGLRTILRQDPDVVMVGETRDEETAAMAVQAALTGHIVFTTIHTNDATGVVTRLLDMNVEPFLVATSLSLAVAQRLIRTICNHCRVPVSGTRILEGLEKEGITQGRLDSLDIEIDPDLDYFQGTGCERCRNTGYSGRTAVFEVFEMTEEARELILSPEVSGSRLRALAKKGGMTTLIHHGIQLVEEEVTTFQEVLRVLGEEV